jgi:hypothetical protein
VCVASLRIPSHSVSSRESVLVGFEVTFGALLVPLLMMWADSHTKFRQHVEAVDEVSSYLPLWGVWAGVRHCSCVNALVRQWRRWQSPNTSVLA